MATEEQIAQAAEALGVDPTKLQEDLAFSNPDPAVLEQIRQEREEREQTQQLQRAAEITAAAAEVVDAGEATPGQIASMFAGAGDALAHETWLAAWKAREALQRGLEDADLLKHADAETYSAYIEDKQEQTRAADEAAAQQARNDLAQARIDQVRSITRDWVATEPGARTIADAVWNRVLGIVGERQSVPDTPEEQTRLVQQAVQDVVSVDNAHESITQQVDAEWRIRRNQSGGRDGLVTAADIARAEAAYKSARFAELAEDKMIDHTLPTSPADETIALTEKYRARQQQFAGSPAAASGLGGDYSPERKRAYEEAKQRAEDNAYFGAPSEIKSTPAQRKGWGDPFEYGPPPTR